MVITRMMMNFIKVIMALGFSMIYDPKIRPGGTGRKENMISGLLKGLNGRPGIRNKKKEPLPGSFIWDRAGISP